MINLYCKHCGASFEKKALLAMLIDAGARVSGSAPDHCTYSPDKLHDFVSAKDANEALLGEKDE